MKAFIAASSRCFKLWFHKRNIIIVSEHKVLHVPISGRLQFCFIALLTTSVCWASYSTGSFMAARSALKEQGRALRSVTNARIETGFSPLQPAAAQSSENSPVTTPGEEPMFTLSALEHDKLATRIAQLEHKVVELEDANDAIIRRVHDKTAGHIDDLESIIRQTGLSPTDLEKQAENGKAHMHHMGPKAEGGPYIPDMPGASPREYAMYDELDTLSMLRQVVGNLPLARPIHNAEEQSPFGHRVDPFTGHLAFHSGLDLAGPAGSKISTTANGKVTFTGWNGSYGNCIDIDHGMGVSTRYGHLSEILVNEGQVVNKGDIIGIQGSTGRSTGAHLHYEVRYHDQPMNPENFLVAGQNVSED